MSTIAAISTPFGRGGIAVIRISGENALNVAGKMFIPACGCDLREAKGGQALYGKIVSEGEFIDDGIATVFLAPKSFTGEDTVEISCHGGILLTERVLKTAFDNGAVQAQAGEFSQRAFLNGKISLSEAEAIIGLIDAENEEKMKLSASHSAGVLKKRCDEIYGEIMRLVSAVYVRLDYPEEDLADVSDEELLASLKHIYGDLSALEATYRHGKAVAEGVKTALIGKPNAGKSSILNALVGEDRAIVTPIAGTTRDIIEEKVNAGRVILRLFDTAGIREGADEVEKIGIERAIKKADEAELIIAVFDTSAPLDEQDRQVLDLTRKSLNGGKCVIFALNKSDCSDSDMSEILALADGSGKNGSVCTVSALTGEGIEDIKKLAEAFFCEREINYHGEAVLANARQFSAVCAAKNAIGRAIDALENSFSSDVCGLDLEMALAAIGELDGRAVSSEITDTIFHNFCVGK